MNRINLPFPLLSGAQFGLFRAATDHLLGVGRKLSGVLGLLDKVLLLGLLVLRLRLLVLRLGLELGLRLSLDILDGVGLDVGGRGRGRRLRSNLLVGDWLLGRRGNRSSANSRSGSTGSARHAVKTCGTVAVKVDAGEDERDDVKEELDTSQSGSGSQAGNDNRLPPAQAIITVGIGEQRGDLRGKEGERREPHDNHEDIQT